jgi:hypothetical protein
MEEVQRGSREVESSGGGRERVWERAQETGEAQEGQSKKMRGCDANAGWRELL